MTAYRTYNTYALLTTVLVLVLSVLACAAPMLTTAPTTPVPTVVKAATTVPPKPEVPDNTLATAQVTASEALHVRAEPMGLVLGYLRHGDSVILTGKCQTGWAEIEWDGGTAWVKAYYLSENKCQTK